MTDSRKHYTAEQKIAILRRHLLEHVAVSDVCDEYGIQPSVFYRWQQQLFENCHLSGYTGPHAFTQTGPASVAEGGPRHHIAWA